jgi:hypothetical protein
MRIGLYALIAATALVAAPATADTIGKRLSPTDISSQVAVEVPGVGVRIGEPRRDRHWDERRRWRDREVRSERRGCKTVTVQEETPRGTVTRTRTRC